jgi:beta-glucosidase-like glycosyl hydrolase
LTEVLRDEWGFDGYVVSDCGAIDCIQNTQYVANNKWQMNFVVPLKNECVWELSEE